MQKVSLFFCRNFTDAAFGGGHQVLLRSTSTKYEEMTQMERDEYFDFIASRLYELREEIAMTSTDTHTGKLGNFFE